MTQIPGGAARTAWHLKRALYRGGRPSRTMRWWNRLDALLYATGLAGLPQAAVLEVRGRRSGRLVSVPVAVTGLRGSEYLVSMLGPDAGWVRNVAAADGHAALRRRGRRTPIRLHEVPDDERAPVLRRYAAVAPGARPHLGLGPEAPQAEFRRIAGAHPVFRICTLPPATTDLSAPTSG